MITADEARKRSEVIRDQLAAERRNSLMKSIEINIMDAVAVGEGRINIPIGARDIEYVREKILEAGYEVAEAYNNIVIRWMR